LLFVFGILAFALIIFIVRLSSVLLTILVIIMQILILFKIGKSRIFWNRLELHDLYVSQSCTHVRCRANNVSVVVWVNSV
jgi:hypothetical protein